MVIPAIPPALFYNLTGDYLLASELEKYEDEWDEVSSLSLKLASSWFSSFIFLICILSYLCMS